MNRYEFPLHRKELSFRGKRLCVDVTMSWGWRCSYPHLEVINQFQLETNEIYSDESHTKHGVVEIHNLLGDEFI